MNGIYRIFLLIVVVAGFSTVVNAALSDGIVMYYNFSQTSGPLLDSVDLPSLANSTAVTITDQAAVGIIGTAWDFELDNSDTAVMSANRLDSINGTQNRTVCMWAEPESLAPTRLMYFNGFGPAGGPAGSRDFILSSNGLTNFGLTTNGGGGDCVSANASWTFNEFSFVCVVYDGTNEIVDLYQNATQIEQCTSRVLNTDSSNFQISGSRTPVIVEWDGRLDELGVWNRTLSSAEISELYNDGSPGIAQQFPFVEPPPGNLTATLSITAIDIYDGSAVSNFSVTVTNTTTSFTNRTTTGTVVFSQVANLTDYNLTFNATRQIGIIDGLISYYNFNGHAGDMFGTSGGTLNGLTCTAQGISQTACDFIGASSFINMTNTSEQDITGEITLMAWVNPRALLSINYILSKGDEDTPAPSLSEGLAYSLSVSSGGNVRFTSNFTSVSTPGSIPIGNYTHVALTLSDATDRALFYFNGTLVSNQSFTQDILSQTKEELLVGAFLFQGVPQNFWNGTIDEMKIYDRVLTSDEIQFEFDATEGFFFTNQQYFSRVADINIVGDQEFVFNPFQVYAQFNATQIFTGFDIQGINISTLFQTNSSFTNQAVLLLKAGTHVFNISGAGHFNNTETFTFNQLDNVTNIIGFANALFNLTAFNGITNETITVGYSLNISPLNLSTFTIRNTATATVNNIRLLKDYNFSFTADFNSTFVTLSKNFTILDTFGNLSLFTQLQNSVNIEFFRETDRTLLNGVTVFADFIGPTVLNLSTFNATLFVDNLGEGSYEIRYRADGFDRRSFFFDLQSSSIANFDLFLLNNTVSTLIEVRVSDENDDPIVGALLKVLRFYPGQNLFNIVEISKTNFNGDAPINIIQNTQEYRLIVERNGVVLFSSGEFKITSTPLRIQIVLGDSGFIEIEQVNGVQTLLTTSGTTGNRTFTYTFSDTSNLGTGGCIKVIETTLFGFNILCNICTQSIAATLVCTNINSTSALVAEGSINSTDQSFITDTNSVLEEDRLEFANLGPFLALLVFITLVAVGSFNPAVGFILGMLALTASILTGFIVVSTGAIVALLLTGFIVIARAKK